MVQLRLLRPDYGCFEGLTSITARLRLLRPWRDFYKLSIPCNANQKPFATGFRPAPTRKAHLSPARPPHMPPRGSVRDPETGKYYPEGSEHAQEILTARATVKNIPVDVAQNLTTEVKELQTPSTQTSDKVLMPMDNESVPAWLAAILRQNADMIKEMKDSRETQVAQYEAVRVQNENLIVTLTRSRTASPARPATTVTVDNANLMLTKELKASDIGSFKPLDLADATSTQLFIDEIDDAVKHYTEARVIMALHKCLRNDLACQWFSSLSYAEKTTM